MLFNSCEKAEQTPHVTTPVVIFPNPFTTSVGISIFANQNDICEVTLYGNITEENIKYSNFELQPGNNSVQIAIPNNKNQSFLCSVLIGDKLYQYQLFRAK